MLFLTVLVALLLLFDGYYFFIRRGVWPGSYVQQLLARPEDNFTRSRIYNDLFTPFAYGRNGIDPRLTTDGVHPNYLGYQLWYSVIQPLL